MLPHPPGLTTVFPYPLGECFAPDRRWLTGQVRAQRTRRTATLDPDDFAKDGPEYLFRVLDRCRRNRAGKLLLAEWTESNRLLGKLLDHAARMNASTIFIKSSDTRQIFRILVATAGGPHTLQQLSLASNISEALQVPIKLLHVAEPTNDAKAKKKGKCGIDLWTSRLLGIDEVEHMERQDLVAGILQSTNTGDALVLGAPAPYYITRRFEESVPGRIARMARVPVIMVHARQTPAISLRNLFWGRLILPDIRPTSQRGVIEELVAALIRHKQVPPSAMTNLVERALRTEQAMPIAVDCQTAFPHIRLPGFRGIAATMAVSRQGIACGGPEVPLTHFFFLFITSNGLCDEYLSVVGRIARRMVRPEIRTSLLKATSPAGILDLLEPGP